MSDVAVSGLPQIGVFDISTNTNNSQFYYFPSGVNPSCTNLTINVTTSGTIANIGSSSIASKFAFPVTINADKNTIVNLLGELNFDASLILNLKGVKNTSKSNLPLINIGTSANYATVNVNGKITCNNGGYGKIYLRNRLTKMTFILNAQTANEALFNVSPNEIDYGTDISGSTLVNVIVPQDVITDTIDTTDKLLYPSVWTPNIRYNMILTGSTTNTPIKPWSDAVNIGDRPDMIFISGGNIAFDFTNSTVSEDMVILTENYQLDDTLNVNVTAGNVLNLHNLTITAPHDKQAIKLYGQGTVRFNADPVTNKPSVTLITDNCGYVYIDSTYADISGYPYINVAPNKKYPQSDLRTGIDPAYAYEQSYFLLNQTGNYIFTDFSLYPIKLDIKATPVTLSDSTFRQGMSIDFINNSGTIILNNSTIGGLNSNYASTPVDLSGNSYLIYTTDVSSRLVINPNCNLQITSSTNFIYPTVSVSGSGATYKITAIPDNRANYIFTASMEHRVVFAPTVVQLSTSGAYTLKIDDFSFNVLGSTLGTSIVDSSIHTALAVDGLYNVSLAGNTFHSTVNTYNTPLVLSNNVKLSSTNSWYMKASSTYPYSGLLDQSTFRHGLIHLGIGTGGDFNMSDESWYDMSAVLLADHQGSYNIDVSIGHSTNMKLTGTGNSNNSTLRLDGSAGVTLIAKDNYTFNIGDSTLLSGGQDAVLILEGSGNVLFQATSSTLTAQNGNAIITKLVNSIDVSYTTAPVLYYQNSPTTYNFSHHYRDLEYDLGIKLLNATASADFTFNGFSKSIKIVIDNSFAKTPIITDSSFKGVDLHTLANSQVTVSASNFDYDTSSTVVLTSGAGKVTLSNDISLHQICGSLNSLFQVGNSGDSCSFISNDNLDITQVVTPANLDYGLTAYTTGNINIGPMDFNNLVSRTKARWYNLNDFSVPAQPFISDKNYIAYSYDPTTALQFSRYDTCFTLNDVSLSKYRFSICSGRQISSTITLGASLNVVVSELINDASQSDLDLIYSDWTNNYYGGLTGTNTKSSNIVAGNTLIHYDISLVAIDRYLGDLTVDASFVETGLYGDAPVEKFSYAISDQVVMPNLTVTDYTNGDEAVDLSTNYTAIVKVSVDKLSVLPLYIMPYTGTDNSPVYVRDIDISYAGPLTSRHYINYQNKNSNPITYLTYERYTDAFHNSQTVYSIQGDTADIDFKIMSVSGEEYFTYGVLPFFGYYTRDISLTSRYVASSTVRSYTRSCTVCPSLNTHILTINNRPNTEFPYPIISDTESGFSFSNNVTLNGNNGGTQVGTFYMDITYNQSTIHYDYDFWFKATVDTSGIAEHVYKLVGDTAYFNYDFSTDDPDVQIVKIDNCSATITIGDLDTVGHRIDVSVTTNKNLDQYYFNSNVSPLLRMTDTTILTTLITPIYTPDVSISTYFRLPPVVLVGFGDVSDSSMASMSYSSSMAHQFNRSTDPIQSITLKTVGTIASAQSLNYGINITTSDAVVLTSLENKNPTQNITITSSDGHNKIYDFSVHSFSETHKILNDGMSFTMNTSASLTTYNSKTLNGGDGIAYKLLTISAARFDLSSHEFRNMQFNYVVGPHTTLDSSLNNYSSSMDATNWTIDNSVTIHPTSRIYNIGFTVSLNSIPYTLIDGLDSSLIIDLSFNDGCGNGLTNGQNGFNVYTSNSLTALRDTSLTLTGADSTGITGTGTWSVGQSFFIYAPDCSISGVPVKNIYIKYKVTAAHTDYHDITDQWQTLAVLDYSNLADGTIEATQLSIGNWNMKSDENGNLLFEYSVVQKNGSNEVVGTYILTPVTSNKTISSM